MKSDFGKYIVIFLFMTLTIGFVSGFLVADDSMLAAYDEGFEKYNIEHGNFTLSSKASESDLKKIEKMEKYESAKIFIGMRQQMRIWTETKRKPCVSIRSVPI